MTGRRSRDEAGWSRVHSGANGSRRRASWAESITRTESILQGCFRPSSFAMETIGKSKDAIVEALTRATGAVSLDSAAPAENSQSYFPTPLLYERPPHLSQYIHIAARLHSANLS